jgi:succinoglycan biosynthesis transport protein ExoP
VDFGTIVGAIRRRWWVLAIAALVGIFVGNLASSSATREYTATTRLFVAAAGGNSSSEAYTGSQFSEQRAESYAQMITSQQMTQRVVDQLQLPMSAQELSSEVTAAIVPRTVLLDVTATNASPERAAAIANSLADAFIQYAGPLETPAGQSTPRSTITVVNRAQVPLSPSSPDVGVNAVYGFIGGILVGLVGLSLVPVFSRRIHSTEELGRFTGAPTVGPITMPGRNVDAPQHRFDSLRPGEAEQLRRLRVQIDAQDPPPQVVLIAPASSSDAAAALGVGLAAAFSEAGRTTALIAADPTLDARWLGLADDAAGLADVLDERSSFDDVLHRTVRPDLYVVPPGRTPVLESFLSSAAMSTFVDDLRKECDRVVIVTASVNDSSAASVVSAIVDADLLVVHKSKTRRGDITKAMSELKAARVHLLAVVLAKS